MMPYLLFSSPSLGGQAKPLRLRAAMLGCSIAITTMMMPLPSRADDFSDAKVNEATAALSRMFSPVIRNTLGACFLNGGVNLAQNATKNGFVICGDGSKKYKVPYQDYLETNSDFLSGLTLIRLHKEYYGYSLAERQRVGRILKSELGPKVLRNILEANGPTYGISSGESLDILLNVLFTKVSPFLQDFEDSTQFLDNVSQYQQIVNQFCTNPGRSVAQAQAEIPGVSSVQLFATCIKASGLVEATSKARKTTKTSPASPSAEPSQQK